MPELSQIEQLDKQDQDFLKRALKYTGTVELTKSTMTALNKYSLRQYFSRGSSHFDIGNYLLMHIKTTQLLTCYIDDINMESELTKVRNTWALDILKLIYCGIDEHKHKHEMPEKLSVVFDNIIYEATLWGFNKPKIISFWKDYYIEKAYEQRASKNSLQYMFDKNMSYYEKHLNELNFMSKFTRSQTISQLKNLHDGWINEYIKNTVSVLPVRNIKTSGLIGVVCLATGWGLGFPELSLVLGSLGTLGVGAYTYLDGDRERQITDQLKKEKVKNIDMLASKVKKIDSKAQQKYLELANKKHTQEEKKAFFEDKVRLCARWKFLLLLETQQLNKIELKTNEKSKKQSNGDNFVLYSSFGKVCNNVNYTIDNLKKFYGNDKESKNSITDNKTNKQGKKEKKNTYTHVSYQLLEDHQKNGCLAVKEPSMAYFCFSNIFEKLSEDIKKGIKENKYSLGAKKGEFGCFKYLTGNNKEQYELKFLNGIRITFEEVGKVTVEGSDGSDKEVPHYSAVRMEKK